MKAGTLYNSNLHQEQVPHKLNVLSEGRQKFHTRVGHTTWQKSNVKESNVRKHRKCWTEMTNRQHIHPTLHNMIYHWHCEHTHTRALQPTLNGPEFVPSHIWLHFGRCESSSELPSEPCWSLLTAWMQTVFAAILLCWTSQWMGIHFSWSWSCFLPWSNPISDYPGGKKSSNLHVYALPQFCSS